jgi:hypothetical protein
MTIGELMLRRADRAAQAEEAPATASRPAPAQVKRTAPRIEKRQATAISCVFLAFIAVALIVVLLSSYTGLSITASPADSSTVVSGEDTVVSGTVEDVTESSSFDNVLGAMYQSFGE